MGMKIYTAGELAALVPVPAIVESVDAQDIALGRRLASELRELDAQTEKKAAKLAELSEQREKADRLHAEITKARDAKRLALGRFLAEKRPTWPQRGPNAKGWGDFLAKVGIPAQTALDLMRLSGYVDEVSTTDPSVVENIPSVREVNAARASKRASEEPEVEVDVSDLEQASETISAGSAFDLRLGAWATALADVGTVDALITDPPYGARTHAAAVDRRADGVEAAGLTPTYDAWTEKHIEEFVAAWAPRCRGWIVALTDSELIPVWRAVYERHGRYAFAPVPCVITGMSVRIQGDGPSSWAVYAMVSRPRELSKWGTLPGAYVGPAEPGAKSGRGKPSWLMEKLVGDYTRAGDLVCDPMAGYGTTLTAALRLDRRAVGSEIDAEARTEAIARWRASRG